MKAPGAVFCFAQAFHFILPCSDIPQKSVIAFFLLCSRPCEGTGACHWCPFLLCSACLLVSGWLCPCLPVSAQCPFLLELPQIKNFTVQGSLGTEFRGSGHLAFRTAIVQHPQCSGVPGLFLVELCKTFKLLNLLTPLPSGLLLCLLFPSLLVCVRNGG